MAVGLVITATLQSIPQYFIGSVVTVFGVGIFGAIDQAIGLNTLPKEEGQNGRFIGIFNLANQLAQGVGPFFASLVVLLAAGDYAWVYLVAAALAVVGALLILPVRAGRTSAAAVDG
jgi:MFS family permease